MKLTRPRMFAIFGIAAFGGTSLIALLFPGVFASPSPAQKAVAILYLLPALFATLLLQGPILRQPILAPLGLRFQITRYWAAAPLVAGFVVLAGFAICHFAFGYEVFGTTEAYLAHKRSMLPPEALEAFDLAQSSGSAPTPFALFAQGLVAGVTLNFLLALPTELAFRGFLFREIQGGFWRRALLGGVFEALYFAPVVALGFRFGFTGADASYALLILLVWCLSIAPPLVYLRARSGSLIPVVLFRGALLGLVAVGSDLTAAPPHLAPVYGLSVAVAFSLLLIPMAIHDSRQSERLLASPARSEA